MALPGQPQISEEDRQRMMFRQAMTRKKRKEREAAGEIKELNITAMMDMMTIILVFLLKSYSASAISMTASDEVRPPISTTRATPKDTVAVTITPKHVMVGDKSVVTLAGGQMPANVLEGRLVVPLDQALNGVLGGTAHLAGPTMAPVLALLNRRPASQSAGGVEAGIAARP